LCKDKYFQHKRATQGEKNSAIKVTTKKATLRFIIATAMSHYEKNIQRNDQKIKTRANLGD